MFNKEKTSKKVREDLAAESFRFAEQEILFFFFLKLLAKNQIEA